MVMGIMILMAALIIGLVLATGVVAGCWNNSIAEVLNPAEFGSRLLSQLAIISSFNFWSDRMRMLGMAFL